MFRYLSRLLLFIVLIAPGFSFGKPQSYHIESGSELAHYYLPYTTGTSEGVVKALTGNVTIDFDQIGNVQGDFYLPLTLIDSGSAKRNCHLREALGLNYQVSDFPKEHVCDGDEHLPDNGKNAVVYPEVRLKVLSVRKITDSNKIEVVGEWDIHGVKKIKTFELTVTPQKEKVLLQGEVHFLLSEFHVQVKPAQILFVKIAVHDEVRVVLNLKLIPLP